MSKITPLPATHESSRDLELDAWRWLQSRGHVSTAITVQAAQVRVEIQLVPYCSHFAPITNYVVGWSPSEVEWSVLVDGLVSAVAIRQDKAGCSCRGLVGGWIYPDGQAPF